MTASAVGSIVGGPERCGVGSIGGESVTPQAETCTIGPISQPDGRPREVSERIRGARGGGKEPWVGGPGIPAEGASEDSPRPAEGDGLEIGLSKGGCHVEAWAEDRRTGGMSKSDGLRLGRCTRVNPSASGCETGRLEWGR